MPGSAWEAAGGSRHAHQFFYAVRRRRRCATITAIPSNFAGAAGGNQNIVVFDESWAYVSERSRRLWDEMVPPPTRKIGVRLTTTYAGFTGESTLLEELYARGMAQPEVAPDLRAGDGMLFFWSHTPIAPRQTESWLAEMRRSLRPNAYLRLVENRFVGSESSFIDLQSWDACVDPAAKPVLADRLMSVWIGVDASVKHDLAAIVAVTWDDNKPRLVAHRVFQPKPDDPIDFEAAVEKTLHDFSKEASWKKWKAWAKRKSCRN